MYPRRSRTPWAPVLALVGLLAGLGIAALVGSPRIAGVSPAPDRSDLPSEAPIEIAFTTAMDAASVESRFHTEPSAPGRVEWAEGGRVMRFLPAGRWPEGGRVQAALAPGARSARGLPLWQGQEWAFTVGEPSIAFISAPDGTPQLYRLGVSSDSAVPTPITASPRGVYDFDVSPDGTRLVFSALREDGGADLRTIAPDGTGEAELLACPGEACVAPAFSPDGAWLAFERRPLDSGPRSLASFGNPRVWTLDLATGQARLEGDPTHTTGIPEFAPTGALAFLDSTLGAIVITDPRTRASTYIPNTSGDLGDWAPDGRVLVFPEITFPPEPTALPTADDPLATPGPEPEHRDSFYSHLLQVVVETNAAADLSGETFIEDSSPAFSPSGDRLAFARRYLDDERFTPGRQLWIMNSDGSGARPLTDSPNTNHSALAWNPDGTALVFMKFNLGDLASPASIWIVDADGAHPRRLAPSGYLPRWIP